jgi:hypothetical protein
LEQAAQSAAATVASAAGDDLMYGERLKAQLAVLQDEFPGWEIWYVLLYPVGARWCARPGGCQDGSQTVYADSPVELAGAVSDVITGDAP